MQNKMDKKGLLYTGKYGNGMYDTTTASHSTKR